MKKEKDRKTKGVNSCTVIAVICVMISAFLFSVITASAEEVEVSINAPDDVRDKFTATIDIDEVMGLDSGQFDISFNASVVNITSVEDGMIDGREIPVEMWNFMDKDTIRVLFNFPGVTGVSGSGYSAKIDFEVTGKEGDNSVLNISNGLLVDKEANEIAAIWLDGEVKVRISTPAATPFTPTPSASAPAPPEPTIPIPGFGIVFATAGVLAAFYLLVFKFKNKKGDKKR